jgi:hypothetical protein
LITTDATTGSDATLNDTTSVSLGGSSVGGALNLTGAGAISQSGSLTINGTSVINAGTSIILLNLADNDFTGAVTLITTGPNVSIKDKNSLSLGSLTGLGVNTGITAIAGSSLTTQSTAFSTGSGNIDLQSNGGSLTTSGSMTTTTGSINLAGSNGVLTNGSVGSLTSGAVSITSSDGNVQIDSTVSSSETINLSSGNGDIQINGAVSGVKDVTVSATNGSLVMGVNATQLESKTGDLNIMAVGEVIGTGGINLSAVAGDLTLNNELSFGGAINLTAATLNINKNVTNAAGDVTLKSAALTFGQNVTMHSAGKLTLPTLASEGALTLNSNSDMTLEASTVENGDFILNAGIGALTINGSMSGSNEISMTANDLIIDTNAATIVAGETVTISDTNTGGLGMVLGGAETGKLQLSGPELQAITSTGLILKSLNGITLKGDLNLAEMTTLLTINANTLKTNGVSKIILGGGLDLVNTNVTTPSAFAIDIDGAFAMNGTISTTFGTVSIDSGLGITMGAPSSITTTNGAITLITSTKDIKLGLLDAGTAAVSVTATIGNILNNNGVFADVDSALTNIKAGSVSLVASNGIGLSSSDAITVDINENNSISLTFGADNAFINNLNNSPIVNNSLGTVIVGSVFSNQVVGIGINMGSNSYSHNGQLNAEKYAKFLSDDLFVSVLGSNFEDLFGNEEGAEDEMISTIIPSVPVLVEDIDGWQFVAPTKRQILEKMEIDQRKGVK